MYPCSASKPNTSLGNQWAASHSWECGSSSFSTNRRTVCRNSSCSSVNGGMGRPAALAPNAPVLIAGLAGVGIGAAVLTPASLAIVTNSFRGERRGLAVGVWGGASALFQGIGPAIGGLFTQETSWRWILWLNVVVGGLILLGIRRTAESYDKEATRHIDITGVALSVTGLGALTLAFNEAPTPWSFGSVQF